MALAPKTNRYAFVDLLRGFALMLMIEAHVVNAFLRPALRDDPLYHVLSFVNGLVAPAFLFASGFSIYLQGRRNWQDWLHFGPAFWRQLRRLGFIALVAYYTHLQGLRLSRYLEGSDEGIWLRSLQADILQCIVASLLLIHLLIITLRTPARFARTAGCLAIAVSLLTPWMWEQDFTRELPLALALFLNPHGISLFPIFPWSAFVLAGACTGFFFVNWAEMGSSREFMRRAAIIGAASIILSMAGLQLPWSLPGHVDFWTTSPLFVLFRFGCVLIFCAALYRLEGNRTWWLDRVRIAGQQSLLVYGVHLWFIFAVLRGKHLGPIVGLEGGFLKCAALSSVTALLMLWLARRWQTLKRTYPVKVLRAQAAAVILIVLIFLLR
jgi:uncharacterized membrane protein